MNTKSNYNTKTELKNVAEMKAYVAFINFATRADDSEIEVLEDSISRNFDSLPIDSKNRVFKRYGEFLETAGLTSLDNRDIAGMEVYE